MSTLGDYDITQCMVDDSIVIQPFVRSQLNNASYDVTLGRYIWEPVPMHLGGDAVVDPCMSDPQQHFCLIDMEEYGPYAIKPGGFVLAHTIEFIGGKLLDSNDDRVIVTDAVSGEAIPIKPKISQGILGELKTKSTVARWGLDVCRAAGWGDVGYINRWTMELSNESPWSLLVRPGIRIAQMVFKMLPSVNVSSSYEKTGSYQQGEDLDDIESVWDPSHMLPKNIKMAEVQ